MRAMQAVSQPVIKNFNIIYEGHDVFITVPQPSNHTSIHFQHASIKPSRHPYAYIFSDSTPTRQPLSHPSIDPFIDLNQFSLLMYSIVIEAQGYVFFDRRCSAFYAKMQRRTASKFVWIMIIKV